MQQQSSISTAGRAISGPWGLPPVLPDLPRVVALSEDTVPGTRVAEVTVSCSNSSGSPNVTLDSIEPDHTFPERQILTRTDELYQPKKN